MPRAAPFVLAAFCCAAVMPAQAGSPSVGRILPRGAQRGTDAVVIFHGARLEAPVTVLVYRAGISVKTIESVNPAQVRATLTIAPDCEPGIYPMRLATMSGISELRLFSVGGSPEISESESNNDRTAPQKVTLPVTVNGTVTREDVDYFGFDAAAGQRVNIEIEAMRLGDTVFDPHIALLDARGAVLAGADDTTLVKQDAIISHTFTAAGTYLIEVRESSYLGDGNSLYRLHVGEFPRPQAVFPPGGAPGQEIELRWIGDAPLAAQKIKLADTPRSDFSLTVSDDKGVSPSPLPFRLNALPQAIEVEPNDKQEQATQGAAPGACAGILQAPGDIDWFRFNAKKGQALAVRVYGRALRSPIDSVLNVYKLGGGHIAGNDDAGSPDSAVRFTIPEDGDYVLSVTDLLHRGGELYVYRVELTPIAPVLSLSTPKGQEHVATPAGNRNAIVVNASRADFSGPLVLELDGIPASLTTHFPRMPANVSSIPIVLEAAQDAAPAAALADLTAHHADASQKISGHMRQSLRLTDFRNNTMCGQVVERLPVSVTKATPFSVRIVEPHVPLVRRGQMDLTVEATRAEGFKNPINLRMLWNPPGVGSGTAQIAADKTRATLRINASDRAALGEWPLVVAASADVGGAVQVSSQLAKLTVADPHVALAVERARVTQGQQTEMLIKVSKKADFPGKVKVSLVGLPRGVTTKELEFDQNATELRFALSAAADAAVGRHGGVHALATLVLNDEPVRFVSPNGLLIVDKPLPPKKNAPKQVAKAAPARPAVDGKKRRVREPRRPEFKPPDPDRE